MQNLDEIARWISENESLLSGLAAMVVLAGVILSPLGRGFRRLVSNPSRDASAPPLAGRSEGLPENAGNVTEAPAPDAASAQPFERVLAVLAFDNLSSDPEMQYFSDGVSEEILLRLARAARIKVIGKASSFQFRGERKSQAAVSLRCSHVLDGSIQRASSRVRISAQMVESSAGTVLWSDRFDRGLEDIFAVQDEISEQIAGALDVAISKLASPALDPQTYDPQRARRRRRPSLHRLYLRHTGRVQDALEETERVYRLDALDPMTANLAALARMAAGQVADSVPIYEDLVRRVPDMSFPVSSLLRAHAFLEDWDSVDRLLALATERQLREFEEGLKFIRAKRDPSPANIDGWRRALEERLQQQGGVDLSQLVYAAHLGLVDEAYHAAERGRLGPAGTGDDVMGPDGYRTALLFQADMPEMRNDPRFPRLCARLGLVDFWTTTGIWPDCADSVPYDFRAECARASDVERDPFGP